MRTIFVVFIAASVLLPSCHTHKKGGRKGRAKEQTAPATKPAKGTAGAYNTNEYIAAYKGIAIKQMKAYGIPASITLAQGILESGNGTSDLARYANNHFGIKCTNDWKGKTYHKDDDEKNACFRSYANPEASFRDHAEFLKRPRYADLYQLGRTDYQGWAKGLKKAGYATNPKYPELLVGIIEKYSLYQYDK